MKQELDDPADEIRTILPSEIPARSMDDLAGAVLSWWYVPETSRRSLQDIEAILCGWQPATPRRGTSSHVPNDSPYVVFRSSESIPSSRTSAISSSSIASSLSSATDLEEERRKELNRSDFSLDERRTRALKMKPIQRGFAETTCGSHERLLLVNALPLNDSDDEDNSSTTRHLPYRKTMIHGRVYLLKNQWV
ncbi:hypothetical protein PR003_g10199 [Phytophthora rubi]|uniref:Uncharacterized protein n=1 Tax=Phytophthora rubi TaxID=129364 RepID=A0A6A4FEQ2_9STRA|nr:hypothetical protein PR003_g10199 [Phytophthora rubi]